MKKHMIVGLGMVMAVLAGMAQAQGDAKSGKTKSETCAGCHGEDGNAAAPVFPKLAGQHASYLTKQLKEFRSQKRLDQSVMNAMAESLTDADIADISAWFSQQKIKPEQLEKNDLGQKIFRSGLADKGVPACAACHGPNGEGNPTALYPALAGQHGSYIGKTLNDYKSGERVHEIMQRVASRLSEEEIEAVSEFASGLR